MNAEKQVPSRYHGRRSRTVPASFLDKDEAAALKASCHPVPAVPATERHKTPRRAPIPVSLLDEEERARAYAQRMAAATKAAMPINTSSAGKSYTSSIARAVTAPMAQQPQKQQQQQHAAIPSNSGSNLQQQQKSSAEDAQTTTASEGLSRTRSRYRRHQNAPSVDHSAVPPPPPPPPVPSTIPLPIRQETFNMNKVQTSLSEEPKRMLQSRRTEPISREVSSSGSASSSDSKEGGNYAPEPQFQSLNRSNTSAQPRSREIAIRLGNTSVVKLKTPPGATVGQVLDQACELPPKTIRGAAVLVERPADMQFERGLHEVELISNIVDGWEVNQRGQELYVVVDIARSALLHPLTAKCSVEPPVLSDHFYYGSGMRPVNWSRSKRYVAVEEGKLIISKREHEKEKSRGVISKLDLLRFGVYSPQDPTKNNHYDSPRRYVIVIKSLEKGSQFLDKSTYIHYLCTKDAELYKKWIDGLSKARNCFLEKRDRTFSKGKVPPMPNLAQNGNHYANVASKVRSSMDFDHPTASSTTWRNRDDQHGAAAPGPLLKADPDEFLSSGLLGKMYDKKREDKLVREKSDPTSNQVFSPSDDHLYHADSLLARYKSNQSGENHVRSNRTSIDRSNRTSMDNENAPLQRSKSTKSVKGRMPQPLLSFDEDAPPIPHHKIRGRGYTVDKTDGPLIQHATQPTHGMDAKSPPQSRQRGLSLSAGKYRPDVIQSPEEMLFPSPFQASSLLANLPDTKVPAHRSHGVATGMRSATQPLMDMSLQSQFAPGSLLAMKERLQDGGPMYKKTAISRVEDD